MKPFPALFLLLFLSLAACQKGSEQIIITPAVGQVPSTAVALQATQPPSTRPGLPTPQPFTPIPRAQWPNLTIDQLHEQIFAELIRRDPEFATDLGLNNYYAIPNDQLTNVSDAYLQETDQLVRDFLAMLQAIDPNTLTADQRISNAIFIWELQDRVNRQPFNYHNYPVNQLFGVQNDLPAFMTAIHPLQSLQDARDYVTRLNAFGLKFDQVIEGLEIRSGRDILPPAFVFDRVILEMRGLIGPTPPNNTLYTTFVIRIEQAGLTEAVTQAGLFDQVEQAITNTVYPAYERLIAEMEKLRPQATTDDGVWKLPNGDAYYRYALSHETSTTLTPDEIHQLGLEEVARIQAEMAELLNVMGYSNPALLFRDAGGFPIAGEATRAQAISAYEQALIAADEKLGHLFNIRPDSPLQIERVPAFREAGSPGAYYSPPPLDGSRPGTFFVNVADGRFVSLVGVPTLAIHEGIPGHHFQTAIQRELTNLPTFRRALLFSAHAEGWALYAEQLAGEQGFYDNNLFGDYGRLQAELFRATRLVVDTGLHHLHWTRQEAIDYMIEILDWPEEAVANEVERYIVWPGQATSYKVGQLTFLRLRAQAQAALGDRFDLAQFHTIILQNGSVPLTVLETIIQEWQENGG